MIGGMPSKLTWRASRSIPVTAALWIVVLSLTLEEVTERVADSSRLEQAGGELVEQRLEGVVVVPVDEHDVGICVLQLLRRSDSPEPATEDQDPRASGDRSSRGRDPPDGGDRLSRLEADHRFARAKGVRRTGHRLDGEAASIHIRAGVAGEEHHVAVALVHPQRDRPAAVGDREARRGRGRPRRVRGS